jgi:hypothetical protein
MAVLLSVPLVFALTGCGQGGPSTGSDGTNPAPSTSPLPPRPAVLRLDAVNPCTLLSSTQLGQLGIRQGEFSRDEDSSHDALCHWDNYPERPSMRYVARLQVQQGADYALGSTTGHQLVQIDGFPAVQTTSEGQDPATHCILVVDVAADQSLWVQYNNAFGDYQGLTHEQSCQFVRAFGEDLMQNLQTQAR